MTFINNMTIVRLPRELTNASVVQLFATVTQIHRNSRSIGRSHTRERRLKLSSQFYVLLVSFQNNFAKIEPIYFPLQPAVSFVQICAQSKLGRKGQWWLHLCIP